MQTFNQLASEIAQQDNLGTQHPIFVVYDWDEIIIDSNHGSGDMKFLYKPEEYSYEDCVLMTAEEKEAQIQELIDEASLEYKEGEVPEEVLIRSQYEDLFEEVDVQRVRRFINVFLTREAAQQFIDQNRYHYNEPHIFVDSAWRNDQLKSLIQAVFEASGTTVPHFWK